MGYTHYWEFKKVPRGEAVQIEKAYQKAIIECTKVIQYYSREFDGLSGFSAHAPLGLYRGLEVNGSERVGKCEPFSLPERYSLNKRPEFCKTNAYPYDTVVVACLIILKHRLGDLIEVNSDGHRDDWNDGLVLARKVLGLKRLAIPRSIHPKVRTPSQRPQYETF
jgi:hypothetical protein